MANCLFINKDAVEQSGSRKRSVLDSSASPNSYFQNHKASLVMSIIFIVMTIWITTITNDLKHKVLRADWTLMRLIFFQPEPYNIVFILSLTTRAADYPLVIVGLNYRWFLLGTEGADQGIHVKPLLPLELGLQLLPLEPRGDGHDVLHTRRLVP